MIKTVSQIGKPFFSLKFQVAINFSVLVINNIHIAQKLFP